MIVIADITVPGSAFELGRLLEVFPDARVELERIVPLHDSIIPLFWVANADTEEVVHTLRESPLTEEARYLTDDGERSLFEVRWSSEVDGFISGLVEADAKMLEGSSTGEGWDFRLQFANRDRLREFREFTERRDIPVMLRRTYNPNFPRDESVLSFEQTEAIVHAYEHGYFEVPRTATVTELAKHFGISDNAYSQRLRRGLSALVYETMIRQ